MLKGKDVQTPSLFGPTLEEALERGRVLTADDLTADTLLARLRSLLPQRSAPPRLSPEQIDEIRGVLHPEIRIGWGHSDADLLRVMDREQERLARSLGDGHRLLRGVAGSGKTVVLVYRARYLRERHPDWRILVVCYNKALAEYLREIIEPDDRLEVLTFHAWCLQQLKTAGATVPNPPGRGGAWHEYWERLPGILLAAYDEGRVSAGTITRSSWTKVRTSRTTGIGACFERRIRRRTVSSSRSTPRRTSTVAG